MGVCMGRSRALGRLPVAYLTCNGSPPVGNTPSLMTFREARESAAQYLKSDVCMLLSINSNSGSANDRYCSYFSSSCFYPFFFSLFFLCFLFRFFYPCFPK